MAPSPPRSSRCIRSSHLRIMDEQRSEYCTDPTTPERSPTHVLYPTYPQPDDSRRPETTSLVVRPSQQTCRTPRHRPPLSRRLYTYTYTQPHLIKSNPIQSTNSHPIPTQPASQPAPPVCLCSSSLCLQPRAAHPRPQPHQSGGNGEDGCRASLRGGSIGGASGLRCWRRGGALGTGAGKDFM